MSERKTDEIKFRVTPTEKAAWQEYAKSAQLGLSELIRREVNEGIRQNEAKQALESELWAAQNARLDGTALIDNAIALLEPSDESRANEDGPDAFEGTLMDGLEDEPPYQPWTFEARNG